MTSPTDEDLIRLRDYHNLNFSDNRSLNDFRKSMKEVDSRTGSSATTKQQTAMKKSLVDNADRWFMIDPVQNQVVENLSSDINLETNVKIIRGTKIPSELLKSKRSILTRRKNIRIRDLGLQKELFAKPIKSVGSRRTWNSVKRFYALTDNELKRFKQQNPQIKLK